MHFTSTVVSSLLLAGGAVATYGSDSGSSYGSGGMPMNESSAAAASTPYATSAAPAAGASAASGDQVQVQVVQVGGAGGALTFTPNDIQAPVGSMVQFQFNPMNHSIVQSNFENPCVPINNIMPNVTGFFSGFMPVKSEDANKPTFTVQVKDPKPIWFYCATMKHCQKGMVGSINAKKDGAKTLDAFIALAAKAPENLHPGLAAGMGGMSSSAATGAATIETSIATMETSIATVESATSVAIATATSAAAGSVGTGSAGGSIGGSSGGSIGGSSGGSIGGSSGGSASGSGAPVQGNVTSTAPLTVSTGAASGSVFAGAKNVYTGAAVAGLLSALMAMAM